MSFGDRLRKLRKQSDMTQENVAQKLNIVRSTYAYYETGKTYPDFDTVVNISKLFTVSTDYLLGAKEHSTVFRDTSRSSYIVTNMRLPGHEWALQESEECLIIAYRYLDKSAQQKILEDTEAAATNLYEQRNKNDKSDNIMEYKKKEG